MTPRTLRWVTGGVAALSIALLLAGLPLAYLGAMAFVLLLFPAGLLPSRRWRPAAWFVAAVYALDTMGFVARAASGHSPGRGAPSAGTQPA